MYQKIIDTINSTSGKRTNKKFSFDLPKPGPNIVLDKKIKPRNVVNNHIQKVVNHHRKMMI